MVAVLGADELTLKQCEPVTGRHRCGQAALVVVPDLAFLHDEDRLAGDVDLTVSFLYIVSLGVDITTQAQLAAHPVLNIPNRRSRAQCVQHDPACGENVTFCLGPHLDADVKKALKRIKQAEGSKFKISKKSEPAPDSDDILFSELRDVVSWACSVRRVRNESGPKTFTADGRPMPT